jgi:glycosyltransferase involved in cell wall biosynthesis
MIDVIIPARNEEKTIGMVLKILNSNRLIGRIIVCVDADTTDLTESIARQHRGIVPAITKELGIRGKGQLVVAGLPYVRSPYVMFCDADYTGLTTAHILTMTHHVAPKQMRIGVPEYPDDVPGHVISAWPWISGFRVVPRELLRRLDLHGYLMETQINLAAEAHRYKFRFRFMPGLVSPYQMTPQRILERERDRAWGIEKGILPGKGSRRVRI